MSTSSAPVYLLLAVLPVVALRKGGHHAALRAFTGLLLVHVGPIAMLVMGAAMYGEGRANSWLELAQTALGATGVAIVVKVTKPLRRYVPFWAFILFFVGVAIMNFIAWFIGGMALADDWV